jgi:hypothetical protein
MEEQKDNKMADANSVVSKATLTINGINNWTKAVNYQTGWESNICCLRNAF